MFIWNLFHVHQQSVLTGVFHQDSCNLDDQLPNNHLEADATYIIRISSVIPTAGKRDGTGCCCAFNANANAFTIRAFCSFLKEECLPPAVHILTTKSNCMKIFQSFGDSNMEKCVMISKGS